MAKVHLICAADEQQVKYSSSDYHRLIRLAASDMVRVHSLCSDADEADCVLFVGSSAPAYRDVRRHPVFLGSKDKCVLWNSADHVVVIMPGVYTNLEAKWLWLAGEMAQSSAYLRVAENDSLDLPDIEDSDPAYLYSFVGNVRNHPVRRRILDIVDKAAFLQGSWGNGPLQMDGIVGANEQRGAFYIDVMRKSQFVLCPRGIGPSSWRLFETMRAGRVPVIISDNWVAPPGPCWTEFSVRVRERDVQTIPCRLRELAGEAVRMGHSARAAWKCHYAADSIFHTVIEQAMSVLNSAARVNRPFRFLKHLQQLQPHFLRHWYLGPAIRPWMSSGK